MPSLKRAATVAEAPVELVEPIQAFAVGHDVIRPGQTFAPDDPIVTRTPGQWMPASLPDTEKRRRRNAALWGAVRAEMAVNIPAQVPPPMAQPPKGRFRALQSWSLPPEFAAFGRINAGDIVDADSALYKRYPSLFVPVTER